MTNKKPPLRGRGLSDLLAENTFDLAGSNGNEGEQIIELKLDDVKPNENQPRKKFDDDKIQELAESIKAHGIFQPIIVSKEGNHFKIVAGERRYRASKLVGNKTIPAIIRNYDEKKKLQIALIENLQREDLNAVEEAKAYRDILDYVGITQEELSASVGKSRSHITNTLGILNLPDEVISYVYDGKISAGHGRVLSKLDNFDDIKKLADKVLKESLSVRKLEELAKGEKRRVEIVKSVKNDQYAGLNAELSSKHRADIKVSNKQITIKADADTIEKIIKLLNNYN